MAISIFKGSLDEDICYDDRGLVLMKFYYWTEDFINNLRDEVDPRVFSNLVFLLTDRWLPRYEEQSQNIKKVNNWWRDERNRIRLLPWRTRRVAERKLEKEYRKRLAEAEIVMDKDSS